MERGTEVQLDAGQLEELRPEGASEDGVTVADDGTWDAVKPHDLVKKRPCHRCRRVWVLKRDEMRVHGEAVDEREYDGLAAHPGKPLDEFHRSVLPHRRWNR